MGLFHVSARLTGPTGRTVTLDLLVDTGATLLVVPRALADQLELTTLRTQPVQTAGGRREIWPVAEVRLAVDGREVTTPCFIAPGGPALLGAVALESLFLAADPVSKRLVPVEGFVGEVKAQCPSLLDRVGPEGIVITKHGRPVAKLIPIDVESAALIGSLKGKLRMTGDIRSPHPPRRPRR